MGSFSGPGAGGRPGQGRSSRNGAWGEWPHALERERSGFGSRDRFSSFSRDPLADFFANAALREAVDMRPSPTNGRGASGFISEEFRSSTVNGVTHTTRTKRDANVSPVSRSIPCAHTSAYGRNSRATFMCTMVTPMDGKRIPSTESSNLLLERPAIAGYLQLRGATLTARWHPSTLLRWTCTTIMMMMIWNSVNPTRRLPTRNPLKRFPV